MGFYSGQADFGGRPFLNYDTIDDRKTDAYFIDCHFSMTKILIYCPVRHWI